MNFDFEEELHLKGKAIHEFRDLGKVTGYCPTSNIWRHTDTDFRLYTSTDVKKGFDKFKHKLLEEKTQETLKTISDDSIKSTVQINLRKLEEQLLKDLRI